MFSSVLLASIIPIGCLAANQTYPPLAWSREGDWIAYLLVTGPAREALRTFPLFAEPGADAPTHEPETTGLTYRLWATRVADDESILIAEGRGPMTSPGWSPDGSSLAFGRVVRAGEGDGTEHYEVVIARDGDRHVLLRRPLEPGTADLEGLAARSVSWSPDGLLLLVPDPGRDALDLVEVETGTIRRRYAGRHASWSPDGDRIAYYGAADDGALDLIIDQVGHGPEPARSIDRAGRVDQPPIWTSDGRSLLFLARTTTDDGEFQGVLRCYRTDADRAFTIKAVENPIMPGYEPLGLYQTIAEDGLDQF